MNILLKENKKVNINTDKTQESYSIMGNMTFCILLAKCKITYLQMLNYFGATLAYVTVNVKLQYSPETVRTG